MILAAGLGTRLKPWTFSHPKALVPVDGIPVLQRLADCLKGEGFDHLVINVHHFAGQVKDYITSHDFGMRVDLSDESDMLLDTGGALAHAAELLCAGDDEPVLIHNVDILSNACLSSFMDGHIRSGNDVTLLTSPRESSRKLLFGNDGALCGWHNNVTDQYKPAGIIPARVMREEAFSGIYAVSPRAIRDMQRYAAEIGNPRFPVMDYLLSTPHGIDIRGYCDPELRLLDIGKPDALASASGFLKSIQ